jgi:multidrug transporter EmrE-like cation transporter
LELISDTFSKQFANNGKIRNSLLALLFAAASNSCWQLMLREGMPLGSGGVLYGVTVALGMLAIGTLVYREKLTPIKIIGSTCGLLALVLLTL